MKIFFFILFYQEKISCSNNNFSCENLNIQLTISYIIYGIAFLFSFLFLFFHNKDIKILKTNTKDNAIKFKKIGNDMENILTELQKEKNKINVQVKKTQIKGILKNGIRQNKQKTKKALLEDINNSLIIASTTYNKNSNSIKNIFIEDQNSQIFIQNSETKKRDRYFKSNNKNNTESLKKNQEFSINLQKIQCDN